MDYIYCIIVFYYYMFIVLNAFCIFLVICLLLKRLYTLGFIASTGVFSLVKIHENFVKKARNSVILLPLGSSLFRFAVVRCKCCAIFPPVQR